LPRPNAKMKISRDGKLTFESNVDAVQWTIQQLIQQANFDTGKFIRKLVISKIRARYGRQLPGKRVYRAVGFFARKREGDLQVGFGHNKYSRSGDMWFAIRQEIGDKGMPKKGFLRQTVMENISQIQTIQGQYLSALNEKNPSVEELNDLEGDDES
jgi:hypothetical protein